MTSIVHGIEEEIVPDVRRVGLGDVRFALAQGFRDFLQHRGDLAFLGVIYPVAILLATAFLDGDRLMPLLVPIIGGLALVGPMLAVGFYELARRDEDGLESRWGHFLDPLKGPSAGALGSIGAVLIVLFIAWVGLAQQIYAMTVGTLNPVGFAGFVGAVLTTPEGWAMIVVGNVVGLLFAAMVLAGTVVALPLLVDRPAHASTAIRVSLRATRRNPGVVATWGLCVAAILFVACIPLFVGLAVALPVLGYASWHFYTRLVDRTSDAPPPAA